MEHEYALRLQNLCQTFPADELAVERLRATPMSWTLQQYEQLGRLLLSIGGEQVENTTSLGDVKDYVESIDVSSQSVGHFTALALC